MRQRLKREPRDWKVSGYAWPEEFHRRFCLAGCFEIVRGRRPRGCYTSGLWEVNCHLSDVGSYRLSRGGPQWTRQKGLVLLLPSRKAFYHDETTAEAPVHTIYMQFSGGEALGLDAAHARFVDAGGRVARELRTILECGLTEGREGYWAALPAFFRVVNMLRTARREPDGRRIVAASAAPPTAKTLAEQVDQYMRANIASGLTLRGLAAHLAMSPSSLSHKYKALTGSSPIAALNRMRVELAKAHLLRGEPLKAVANAVGFCDQYYLSRCFRRLAGMTASAYVNTWRKSSRENR